MAVSETLPKYYSDVLLLCLVITDLLAHSFQCFSMNSILMLTLS